MPDVYADDDVRKIESQLGKDASDFRYYIDLKKTGSACLPLGDAKLVKDAVARGRVGGSNEIAAEHTYFAMYKLLNAAAQRNINDSTAVQRMLSYSRQQDQVFKCEKVDVD